MIKRYQTNEIAKIFDDNAKMAQWLYVERIVAEVEEQEGIIPRGLSKKIRRIKIRPERVVAIEKITNHDVIAFLQAVREKLGKEGEWLHFGLTSYDLVDTAFVLCIQNALDIVLSEMNKLKKILKKKATKYMNTPQMGRTHGMFAQPITFGYKVASWFEEIARAHKRMQIAKKDISYGKLSGAVGTYTMLAPSIEKKVMKKLGLRSEKVSTQVLPRDRFAFMLSTLALYACGLERISTEIRNLSRTEIGEVREPFTKKQKGSSAMPHKKNPILCERVSGLARVVRSFLIPGYENITLWHERDITNSSVERVVIPDAFHLVHYMTKKMIWVLQHLDVFPDRMMENIRASNSVYASQNLMNKLIEKGMSRTKAYRLVQKLSFNSVKNNKDLQKLCYDNKIVTEKLTKKEIQKIFSLKWFLRNIQR